MVCLLDDESCVQVHVSRVSFASSFVLLHGSFELLHLDFDHPSLSFAHPPTHAHVQYNRQIHRRHTLRCSSIFVGFLCFQEKKNEMKMDIVDEMADEPIPMKTVSRTLLVMFSEVLHTLQ